MTAHRQRFEDQWQLIVEDVNQYIKDNPGRTYHHTAASFTDYLCLSGAWIADRITGHSGLPHNRLYRGSLSKKIRKALGYSF